MNILILLSTILLFGACAITPTLEEKVVGTYELKRGDAGRTLRYIFIENGRVEGYIKGEKWKEAKWSINKEAEIHIALVIRNKFVLFRNKLLNARGCQKFRIVYSLFIERQTTEFLISNTGRN